MANSTTKLTISLSGYKNRYPSPVIVNCHSDTPIIEEDWPTHCAFFEKDTDFDISPFLIRVNSADISSENRQMPTYHEFRKLFSDSPEHPSALKSDDVMIDIDLHSPCYGCSDVSSTPVDIQSKIIGQRLAGKPIRLLQGGEESGDSGHHVNIGMATQNAPTQVISLPQQDVSISTTRSQSSFFSAIRKQLSNIFNRPERRQFDTEFYV